MELDSTQRKTTEEKLISACQNIAEIFEWLQQTIGLAYFPCFLVQCATISAYNLLDFLAQPKVPAIFQVMITALSAASRRWTIARGVVKMLWITLQERELESYITEQASKLLKRSAVDNWGPEDHRHFEGSAYPNYAAIAEHGRELADMGDVLEKWSLLDIKEAPGKPKQ